ncbi:MAG TPA: lytic murein transglycosylase B [Steroidobacteraceae bacterium]|nr:lytic murein transglycosylase B [Steroidobacteraceae bacterium]
METSRALTLAACLSMMLAALPATALAAAQSDEPQGRSEPPSSPQESTAPVLSAEPFDPKRPEIRRFVREVARRDGLSRRRVLKLIENARPQPKILDIMTRPPERVLEWWEYRQHLVTDTRIDEGVQFWLEHRSVLERIAGEQGVPPEYIVAILGCETRYGRNTGRDRVLDSLATLAFDYPPRATYFRGELEQFLLLARETHLNPLVVKGSYSGAMGAPQFMPSAYRRYAVDASRDHRTDLWTDWADVFASIGNFLRINGWEPGQPVITDAHLDPDPVFQLDSRGVLSASLAELNAQGVRVSLQLPDSTPALLVPAEQAEGPAYRVGFNNFRAIMRYNRSTRYAMAVNDLAEAIAARVHEGGAAGNVRTESASDSPPT